MNIVIQTAPRKVNLLPLAYESIHKEWNKDIHILEPDNVKEAKLKGIQKAAYGFYRCITMDKTQSLLRLEDDVILKDNWRTILENGIASIEKERKDKQYLITFIRPFEDCVANTNITETTLQTFIHWATVNPTGINTPPLLAMKTFCNTSAVYFSEGLLKTNLAEFIDKYCVHGNAVFDLALGSYLFKMAIPIYVMVPDLAVNIGGVPELSGMKNFNNRGFDDYSDWEWK